MDIEEREDWVKLIGGIILFLMGIAICTLMLYSVVIIMENMSKQAENDRLRDEEIYNYYDKKGLIADKVVERVNGTYKVTMESGETVVVKVDDDYKVEEVKGNVKTKE